MLKTYGVLRGKIIDSIPYKSGTDHFQIEVKAEQNYRIAVDVYSQVAGEVKNFAPAGESKTLDTDRMVMYYKDEDYQHPVTAEILKVKVGLTPKEDMDAAICLDYVRTSPKLFPIDKMRVVEPKSAGNPGEDLDDDIGPWVTRALNNPDAEVFAFGASWDDNAPGSHPETRHYFNPDPPVGIHDIHMNQGDTGSMAHANGVNQDGALFFYFGNTGKWVAMFFRFQVQSTDTDSHGNAVKKHH